MKKKPIEYPIGIDLSPLSGKELDEVLRKYVQIVKLTEHHKAASTSRKHIREIKILRALIELVNRRRFR